MALGRYAALVFGFVRSGGQADDAEFGNGLSCSARFRSGRIGSMKILYLHPRAWTGESSLLRELQSLGHEVCILEEQRDDPNGAWHESPSYAFDDDHLKTLWYDPRRGAAKLLTWPVDRFFKRAFDGRNLGHRMFVIRQACRHFKPDVVLAAEGFAYGIPASILRRWSALNVPLVVNYIGGDILDFPEANVGKRRTPLTSFLIRQGVAGADVLRPFSPLLRDVLLSEGADPRRVQMIPGHMPTDIARLERIAAARQEIGRAVRQNHGIDPDAPVIVTLSANLRGKGLHYLADSWAQVMRRYPRARWLLCGPESAWLRNEVLPRLDRASVSASVIRTGTLSGDSVFEYLASGDLYVMPTLADGGPMSNIEAAGVGTPVLTTDHAGNAPWLIEAGCGEAVPAANAEALAASLIRLLGNPMLMRQMGSAGMALAREFTAGGVARKLTTLLSRAKAV